jgi:3-dehydroquinate dehydratase type I
VPVNGREELDSLLGAISQKKPDLVEFRLDNLDKPDALEKIAQKKSFSAIATDKSDRDAAVVKKLLLTAASAGFEFVDLEFASPLSRTTLPELKSLGAEVILSFHDTSKTPSSVELKKTLNSQIGLGSDICKVVTTAIHPRDNLIILQFLEEESSRTRLVSFAMGRQGVPSRILSPLFGAEFTFASFSEAARTAEGQLTIDDLRSVWHILGIE